MVTAPSNKAITVLASRFIKVLNGCDDLNLALIGVEDKLVADDINDDEASCLKNIFVYTWTEKIQERYKSLERVIQRQRTGAMSDNEYHLVWKEALALKKKLKLSIPFVGDKSGIIRLAQEFYFQLEQCKPNGQSSILHTLLTKIQLVLQRMNDGEVVDELLASANVIFCTLSSSGVSVMKRTRQVDGKFKAV